MTALLCTAGLLLAWAVTPAQAEGDAARGAVLAASRSQGLCVLCHALPGQPAPLQGTIGPALAGVGARLGHEDLRQRLLVPERINPETLMPSYGRTEGLQRVAPALQGRPLLTPSQIDDVVAYLESLK